MSQIQASFQVWVDLKLQISTIDNVHSQGDSVAGEVIIWGGQHEQRGNSIRLGWIEFWREIRHNTGGRTVTKTKTWGTIKLSGEFLIRPRSEQAYPFEFKLPINCRVSMGDLAGWWVVVVMDIPEAVDPKGKGVLRVEPAKEFMAIVKTCEKHLHFQEEDYCRRLWERGVTSFLLVPPEVLKSELDYLHLDMWLTPEGSVRADLVFDLQEKSVSDYFKAIFAFDLVRKSIELSPEQIFDPDGVVKYKSIAQCLVHCLQEAIDKEAFTRYNRRFWYERLGVGKGNSG